MNYLKSSFSVGMQGGANFNDNWEKTFKGGRKTPQLPVEREITATPSAIVRALTEYVEKLPEGEVKQELTRITSGEI